MNFKANDLEMMAFQMRQADWPRSIRRAKIQSVANGVPPYSEKQMEDMHIAINFNDLSHTRECHNARAQYTSAFTKPGAFFTARTDTGAKHKRDSYGRIVTKDIAKIMKRSLNYFESHRSKWGMTVLHGIAPCAFQDQDHWCPNPVAVDDMMVASNTKLVDIARGTLPMFMICKSFSAPELIRLAKGARPDPAWNQKLVDSCLRWIDSQTVLMASSNWSEFWSPEKTEERIKSDGAMYACDDTPVINVFDCYFYRDSKEGSGWNRRMILDSWTTPDVSGMRTRRSDEPFSERDQFLYNPGNRNFADRIEQITTWQFADLSAVFPAKYWSVRSLGYLLYAICHVQNKLRCKFTTAMFEQLMVLMRIKTQDDAQRALAVNFTDYAFVDDSIEFIPPSERYQVNAQLAQLGLSETSNLISRNSSSFTAKVSGSENGKIPTATQWMGEEQKVTQLVSAGLAQAYEYQKPEYREIFRRFTKKDSSDPDVREFQAKVLKQGVPEKVLYNLASWEIEPERVVGAGNKTIEMMISDRLMSRIKMYDPDAQKQILKIATLNDTDDAALTDILVPDQPQISNSVHDAQQSIGTLLLSQPMETRQNVNHNEYAMALISALEVEVQKIMAMGGVPESQAELMGLQNLAGVTVDGQPVPGNGAMNHIMLFGQDEQNKAETKQLNDQLGKLMNQVKAFAQRFQEKQQSQNGNGAPQLDAETQQKIISMQALTDSKMESNSKSNAQRTAIRQVQDERKIQRDEQAFQQDLQQSEQEHRLDLAAQAQKDALEVAKAAKLAEIEVKKSEKQAEKAAKQPNAKTKTKPSAA